MCMFVGFFLGQGNGQFFSFVCVNLCRENVCVCERESVCMSVLFVCVCVRERVCVCMRERVCV